MIRLRNRIPILAFLVLLLVLPFAGATAGASASAETVPPASGPVFIIPVDQEIERGLQRFMERGYAEAADYGASLIVLEINTPGGAVINAEHIGTMVRNSPIPSVAFVEGEAVSAGSYIALNADHIVMKPGSMIGAASLVDRSGNAVEDAKLVAYWKTKMISAAQLNGRDPDIAAGMTDVNMVFDKPDLGVTKQQGQIIALSYEEAMAAGYADFIADSAEQAAAELGYGNADMFRLEHTGAEKLAQFLTHPAIMTLLLFVGIAGVIIELIVPGFGVPGIVGIVAFVLYFFGNSVAGFAGSETWLLFIVGLVLMLLEIFVPSFGILGLLGSVALVAGVVRAAFNYTHAMFSLGIAFAAATVVIIIVAVIFKERGIWNRFILGDNLTKESGFVPTEEKMHLLGSSGLSVTPLRPSGTALFNGERIDVVTEGAFVGVNLPVSVVKVEGGRIVVKELKE